MNAPNLEPYVSSALEIQGYSLNEEQRSAIIREFTRIHLIARVLNVEEIDLDLEQAPVYRL